MKAARRGPHDGEDQPPQGPLSIGPQPSARVSPKETGAFSFGAVSA